MDVPLPSTRELELEMLLREKESKVVQLSDELSRLRLYLSTQPPPSTTEPVTLPPTFASLILTHIPHLPQISDPTDSSNNSTTAALTQRVRVLQDENDELYDILKKGETGRLKEEVQSLKRIVHKLEGALKESHEVIISLSTELDKAYQTFNSSTITRTTSPQNYQSNSIHNGVRAYPRFHTKNSGGAGRLPPTGPRAHSHKKQRLSQVDQEENSPSTRSNVPLPSSARPGSSGRRGRTRSRSRSPRGKLSAKMEIDEPQERRSPEPGRDRERYRDRERGDRERGRDRDRDGNRSKRMSGAGGRGGSRRGGTERGEKGSHSLYSNGATLDTTSSGSADRTLAERMGLGI
ncbi:hypothetical protein GYMLUDRAFT_54725 [Collybiopsis luxurians FD-317 M1]|nr:hypothetical protein GYMLUDRAFT_54725 [Collybiopsis luxurians FD-317 M1]